VDCLCVDTCCKNNSSPYFEPFSLGELIQDVLQNFQLVAEKNKITLYMNAAKSLPPVLADIGLCERVLDNLIENALRYTGADESISIRAVSKKNDRIEVQVSDSGSGIRPEDIPQLFDRSSQLKRECREGWAWSGHRQEHPETPRERHPGE